MIDYVVEDVFEHKGLPCVVVFSQMGHRCGYVGVDNTSKFYHNDYQDMDFISVHGGLTYSGGNNKYPIETGADTWWFGFDCSHYGDENDINKVVEYFGKNANKHCVCYGSGIVRSLEYVIEEVKSLAEQLTGK